VDHLFPNIPTNRFDTSGLLSRTLAVGLGETKDVLNFHRDGEWRLSVSELDSATSLLIEITENYAQSQEKISFHCAPGGAVEYLGTGPASVKVGAVFANTNICIQLSGAPRTQFILERDASQQVLPIAPAAYTALGIGGGLTAGHPPPYMNYAAIMCNGNIDVRTISLGGAVIFEAQNLAPQTLLLNQLKIGNHDILQGRGTAAGITARVIWYNQR
jgi:hypothetical protein